MHASETSMVATPVGAQLVSVGKESSSEKKRHRDWARASMQDGACKAKYDCIWADEVTTARH